MREEIINKNCDNDKRYFLVIFDILKHFRGASLESHLFNRCNTSVYTCLTDVIHLYWKYNDSNQKTFDCTIAFLFKGHSMVLSTFQAVWHLSLGSNTVRVYASCYTVALVGLHHSPALMPLAAFSQVWASKLLGGWWHHHDAALSPPLFPPHPLRFQGGDVGCGLTSVMGCSTF